MAQAEAPAVPPLVVVENVSRTYRGGARVAALREISFAIAPGEKVALTGPSGSGKSTLIRVIGALDKPTRGRVLFEGRNIYRRRGRARLRATRIGIVFQSFHLLPTLTAAENVEIPMFGVERSEQKRRERVSQLLEQVGLAARARHRPPMLSGGECQRVAIARALANAPSLLLADEPTGNLDSETSRNVVDLLLSVAGNTGTALVIATHDDGVASRMSRHIALLDGSVRSDVAIAAGSP
jgi:putative ABC transport system ATP-binding protein